MKDKYIVFKSIMKQLSFKEGRKEPEAYSEHCQTSRMKRFAKIAT